MWSDWFLLIYYIMVEVVYRLHIFSYSLVAQMAKNLPAFQETQVQSLEWDDPLEKATTTHSSILAWRIPWTEVWQVTVYGVAKSQI